MEEEGGWRREERLDGDCKILIKCPRDLNVQLSDLLCSRFACFQLRQGPFLDFRSPLAEYL